jgi:tetratricopeptide (TPR) repeat protein
VRGVSLTDLHDRFRDDHQRRRAAEVVHLRLADDRQQEECRSLMRLWWQLTTDLPQIDEARLEATVGHPKLTAVWRLIAAVRSSPDAVDRWIEATSRSFPLVRDRGYELYERGAGSSSVNDRRHDRRRLRHPPPPRLLDPISGPRPGDAELAHAQAACQSAADGAAFELGRILELRGELRRAAAAYRLAGESGDPHAFYALGRVLHALGEPAYRIAAAWQFAADAGLVEAMYALAVVESDSVGRAQRYLRQAAAQGHTPACYALGYRAFQQGEYRDAIRWWTEAAQAGHQIAGEALEALWVDLTHDADHG